MSKLREERYRDIGVTRYVWRAVGDSRTRPLHKELDGKVCLFAAPPISGTKGERENPGIPYGCRCIAIGILTD